MINKFSKGQALIESTLLNFFFISFVKLFFLTFYLSFFYFTSQHALEDYLYCEKIKLSQCEDKMKQDLARLFPPIKYESVHKFSADKAQANFHFTEFFPMQIEGSLK